MLPSTPMSHLPLLPGWASLSSLVSGLGWEKGLEENKETEQTLEMEQGKLFRTGQAREEHPPFLCGPVSLHIDPCPRFRSSFPGCVSEGSMWWGPRCQIPREIPEAFLWVLGLWLNTPGEPLNGMGLGMETYPEYFSSRKNTILAGSFNSSKIYSPST